MSAALVRAPVFAGAATKLVSLGEAAALVRDGDVIGVGGMTLYRKPMAFVRELARTGRKDLTLLGFCSSFEAELLAAADALKTLRTCYFGLEFLGLAPTLRRATQEGRIGIVEETEYTLAVGLQATLMKVPYLPSRDCEVGTDYFRIRPDLKRAACPVTGEELTWFPAVAPRVAVIHAPLADQQGNAWLGGEYAIDAQLAMAAEVTIVTTERVATTAEVRDAQGGASLVSFMVDAVVEVPGGAHPTSCFPDYPVDVVHLASYLQRARRRETPQYLERYVHGPDSPVGYLERILEDADVAR
jgi:glutaconate CoA-transferase, subunit A